MHLDTHFIFSHVHLQYSMVSPIYPGTLIVFKCHDPPPVKFWLVVSLPLRTCPLTNNHYTTPVPTVVKVWYLLQLIQGKQIGLLGLRED